jgi:hypothetical protein
MENSSPDQIPTALVIVPESVNYFYELPGHRLRDALQHLGYTVWLQRLDNFAVRDYDWCFLVNVAEIIQGFLRTQRGTLDDALARFGILHCHVTQRALLLMECVATAWYEDNMRWCDGLQIQHRIDMGYHRQAVPQTKGYHFLFNGLTANEQRHVHHQVVRAAERPIPWVFIGTGTPVRMQVAQKLVECVDSRGVLYLRNPQGQAVGWHGPHINYDQYLRIHQRARLSVWSSHHEYVYVESERFRMAALAGAVPIKLLAEPLPAAMTVPFRFLMLPLDGMEAVLPTLDYEPMWHRFRDACLALPVLEDALQRVMTEIVSNG